MKKLTNYILDLGRVVAYYPGLRKITDSVTATILLCQLIYMCDKSKNDGWVEKNSDELEEETGLSYWEQKLAREKLISLKILEEQNKRLEHKIAFRLNHEEINRLWEEATGKKSEVFEKPKVKKETPSNLLKGEQLPLPIEAPVVTSGSPIIKETEIPTRRTDAKVKGDMMDGILNYSLVAEEKIRQKKYIKEQIESQLNIIADGARWNKFIDFAYTRQEKYKEPIGTFLVWALHNGFDAVYWTPEKMRSLYPQAFVNNKPVTFDKTFVEKLPETKNEEYSPMPESLKKRNFNQEFNK